MQRLHRRKYVTITIEVFAKKMHSMQHFFIIEKVGKYFIPFIAEFLIYAPLCNAMQNALWSRLLYANI